MKSPLNVKGLSRYIRSGNQNRQIAAHQPETFEEVAAPEESGYVSFTFTRDGELIPVETTSAGEHRYNPAI